MPRWSVPYQDIHVYIYFEMDSVSDHKRTPCPDCSATSCYSRRSKQSTDEDDTLRDHLVFEYNKQRLSINLILLLKQISNNLFCRLQKLFDDMVYRIAVPHFLSSMSQRNLR